MPEPIIATKINVPPPRTGLVARPRLLALLDEAAARGLALVAAPAGFGKSTLVAEWLRQTRRPAAWLAIDRHDNDPARFLAYLVRALQPLAPEVGASVLAALGTPQPAEVRALVSQLINDLAAAPSPITLVLDDWHLIDDDQVTLGLQTLVEYQPPQLSLVVITREDPALPLARLRSRGQLGEVRAADLRFNALEAAEFLRHSARLELAEADVAALEQRTEGWIAGLHLAALSMRGAPDPAGFIQAFTGSHRYVLDYLLEEVFARQPAQIQEFLLDSAWLERLSAELCDAALGRAGSAALLEQVEAAGLFLRPLDEARHWYRYHRLFAEALQARQQRQQPQRAAEIHRRAAAWFQAAGWLVDAVEHARQSGDAAHHLALVEQHAFRVMGRGELGLAARWLSDLPEAALRQSPRLCLDQAWIHYLNRQGAEVDPWLDAAEACLPAASDRQASLMGEVLALRSLRQDSDPERALQLGQAAIEATPASNPLVRGLIHMALGTSHRQLGQLDRAFDAFEAAIPLHWQAGNLLGAFMAAADVVIQAQPLGRLDRAEAQCQQALEQARRLGLDQVPAAGVACVGLASVRLERGQWQTASDMLREALRRAAHSGYRGGLRSDVFARMIEARLNYVLQAVPAGAAPADFIAEIGDFAMLSPMGIARVAHLLIEVGQLDQAARLLRHLDVGESQAPHPRHLVSRLVGVYHQVMASLAGPDAAALLRAEAEAGALAALAESLGFAGCQSELLALRALAAHTRHAVPQALADLDQALRLAERDGQVLIFVGKGRPMAELLAAALRQGTHNARFAQLVLDRFPAWLKPPRHAAQPELVEPLTEREIEVLRLVADGLTYAAVAQRLFVSVNTVRYHIKGLYGKLGAGSRAAAIARGRELHLI
jgi:LuxR family transcriptional regulator, maltose regulon positive regulatory protein